MSVRGAHARRALSSLVRRCAHPDASTVPTLAATASGGWDGRVATVEAGRTWREFGAAAATVSALAYFVTDSAEDEDDARVARCKGEKIVWVDSYGKEVILTSTCGYIFEAFSLCCCRVELCRLTRHLFWIQEHSHCVASSGTRYYEMRMELGPLFVWA